MVLATLNIILADEHHPCTMNIILAGNQHSFLLNPEKSCKSCPAI
jgi:hypothetical protein